MPDQTPETNEPSDAELLRRYVKRADTGAMETLFARHADMAYRTAFRVTRNAADAEDAVQTAMIKILRTAENCRGEGVKTWMSRVVVNACKDLIRSAARRRTREEKVVGEAALFASVAGDANSDRMAEAVKQALDSLPERYRIPVWLHHGEGMSFSDIARTLAMPKGTSMSYASRGIEMLRNRLKKSGVPVSAASLVASFTALSAEAAPDTLRQSIGPLIEQPGRFSGLARAPSASRPPVWLKPAWLAGAAVLAGTAGLIALWPQPDAPERPDSALETIPVPEPDSAILYQWDFNAPPDPEVFKPIIGAWRFLPNGGPDGSGCMLTEPENDIFGMIVDVPLHALPVRIAWQQGSLAPAPKLGHMSRFYWESYENLIQFLGLYDMPTRSVPDQLLRRDGALLGWWTQESYATKDFFLDRSDGHMANLIYMPRRGDANLFFVARGRLRIDNLTIRSVAAEQVPNVSDLLAAARKVPPEQRDGRRVALRELKPGRYAKQVEVVFEPGKSFRQAGKNDHL